MKPYLQMQCQGLFYLICKVGALDAIVTDALRVNV